MARLDNHEIYYVRGREKFSKARWAIRIFTAFYGMFPLKIRIKLLEYYRNKKGIIGLGIRYALLKTIAQRCGENVSIHADCYLLNPQNLSLGDNVSINPMCYIECGKSAEGGVTIGNNVSIAHGVTIMASSHSFDDTKINIKDQKVSYRSVRIEDDVWVGAKATILSGRVIKKGAIIAAGAVVTKDVESYTIVAGVPARVIKSRI